MPIATVILHIRCSSCIFHSLHYFKKSLFYRSTFCSLTCCLISLLHAQIATCPATALCIDQIKICRKNTNRRMFIQIREWIQVSIKVKMHGTVGPTQNWGRDRIARDGFFYKVLPWKLWKWAVFLFLIFIGSNSLLD